VDDETMARLAYEEAVRRIKGQMEVLSGVRGRAGTLFGAASLATSFLSSVAARGTGIELGTLGWTAVVLFGFATCVTILMFLSWPGLSFTIQREENEELLRTPPTADASVADTYREFARRLERNYKANTRRMKWFFRGNWILCFLVGAELILWTGDFVT
jgi:hypothetical protein